MEIRRIKILLYVIVLFLIPSFSNIYGATLSKPANNLGLVGYWSFNDATSTVATDFSGRGNTGTLNSFSAPATASSGWGNGKFGPGLNFDGTSDYVSVDGVANDVVETSFAVSLWLKCADHGGVDRDLVASSHSGGGANFELYISSANLFSIWDGSQGASEITSSISGCDSRWHHAVYSRSGATGTLYVDGISQGTHSSSDVFAVDDLWSIGQTYSSLIPGFFFQGTIDDVRIYNRPLSGTEVLNLYNSSSARINSSQNNLVTNGLLGMWSFDSRDIASTIAYDRKGGHNGTISGSPQKKMGKVGQSLYFDGTDDWVNAGSAATLDNPSSLSISAWFKIPTGGGGRILSKSGGVDKGFLLDIMDFSYIRFTGQYNTTDLDVGYSVSLVADEWTHVLLTWDGSTSASNAILYLNGVAVNSFLSTQDGVGTREDDSGADLMIGARSDTGNPRFLGNMDEVRYYNRVLSAGEVKTLYNAGESKINVSQNNLGQSSLNSGLVGLWSFNSKDLSDKVYDRSGQGNDGYFSGRATSTAKTIGKVGQALDFDGTADQVYLGTPASLFPTSAITMSAWIRPDTVGGAIIVLANDDALTMSNQMRTQGTGTRCSIANTSSTQGSTLVAGEWAHIACVYDGANIINYINGVNVGSTPLTGSITYANSNTEPWRIGRRGDAAPGYFDGKIDEVRMYSRALTASEIKQLYLTGR